MNTDFDTLNLSPGNQPGFGPMQKPTLFPNAGGAAPISPATMPRYQVVRHTNAPARFPYVIQDNATGGYVPGGSPMFPRLFSHPADAQAAIPSDETMPVDSGAPAIFSYGLLDGQPDDVLQYPLGFAPTPLPQYQTKLNPDAPPQMRYGIWNNQSQDWVRSKYGFAHGFSTQAEAEANKPAETSAPQVPVSQQPLLMYADYDELMNPSESKGLFGNTKVGGSDAKSDGSVAAPGSAKRQPAAAPQPGPTNGWGKVYNQTVHLRNLYSNELARFRQKYPGHADDPLLVAEINKYDGKIEYMNTHRAPASLGALSSEARQPTAASRRDPTNDWGETYMRAVHDRNLYSDELKRFRQKYPGHPDDPNLVAHIRMYDRQIEHMNSVSPSGELRTNIAAERHAGSAPPEWNGTLEALPGAIFPGLWDGVGNVGDATIQAGEGLEQFAGGIVSGGANAFAGAGDELMGDITGNGRYFRASQQHAKAINPNYSNPNSYVQGRGPGVMADIVQSVAQNPSVLGLTSTVGAGSGGWGDQVAAAAGLYAGGDAQGGNKALGNIPVSEWNYISSNPAQFGVNTLLFALSMRGGMLAKADSLESAAGALNKTGKAADAARATQLMGQAARLRDMANVHVPRAAQGVIDHAARAIERSPVVRQSAAAAYALNQFKNPITGATNAGKGIMPWGAGRGPMIFRIREGSTPAQIEQYRETMKAANAARRAGGLSPTGRVSTSGSLGEAASAAVRDERARAEAAGTPYPRGKDVGHVLDATLSGRARPHSWLAQDPTVNRSLGAQAGQYPLGYRPTEMRLHQPDTPWPGRPQPLTWPKLPAILSLATLMGQNANGRRPSKWDSRSPYDKRLEN